MGPMLCFILPALYEQARIYHCSAFIISKQLFTFQSFSIATELEQHTTWIVLNNLRDFSMATRGTFSDQLKCKISLLRNHMLWKCLFHRGTGHYII